VSSLGIVEVLDVIRDSGGNLDDGDPENRVPSPCVSKSRSEGLKPEERLLERKADPQDAILGESGGRTRTTGGKGRNFFEQAPESWSVDSE
jgi:hypothetical protein